jgi:hypothetical protein
VEQIPIRVLNQDTAGVLARVERVASGKKLTAFVTYNKRLADTVSQVGLPVVAPGQQEVVKP